MKELLTLPWERFGFETQMLIDAVSRRIPFMEIPIETVYVAENADSTKSRLFVEGDLPAFLRFWAKVGLKHKKCYYFYSDSIEEPGVFLNLLPGVNRFYQKIGLFLSFERIPLLSMLFSIGFQFWILLNCAFYVMYRRCRHLYVPVLILLGSPRLSSRWSCCAISSRSSLPCRSF